MIEKKLKITKTNVEQIQCGAEHLAQPCIHVGSRSHPVCSFLSEFKFNRIDWYNQNSVLFFLSCCERVKICFSLFESSGADYNRFNWMLNESITCLFCLSSRSEFNGCVIDWGFVYIFLSKQFLILLKAMILQELINPSHRHWVASKFPDISSRSSFCFLIGGIVLCSWYFLNGDQQHFKVMSLIFIVSIFAVCRNFREKKTWNRQIIAYVISNRNHHLQYKTRCNYSIVS